MAIREDVVINGEIITSGANGGGRGRPAVGASPSLTAPPARKKPKTLEHNVFDNRRGLLLSLEQLSGPPAPAYLLRQPYVYSRQNLF